MDYVSKLKKEIISLLEENDNIDTIGFIYQYLTKKKDENKKHNNKK